MRHRLNFAPVNIYLKLSKIRTPLAVAVGIAVIGTLFAEWQDRLEKRYQVLSTDLALAGQEWTAVSKELAEAGQNQKQLEPLPHPKHLEENRAAPRWAWALRTLATACEGNIELQGLHARQMTDSPGSCDVRIDGVSFGPDARTAIDRFRFNLEQGLKRGQNSGPVKTGFLRFEEEPESSPELPDQRVSFEIAATVGVKDPAVFKQPFRQ